ncbi:MAG: class I SAM-dependent methyltransferase [Rhodanobacteraceae bacterium]
MRTLSPEEAKSYYDKFGRKQDSQAFYENQALEELTEHADLRDARSVFEFGCGTGRFALDLLRHHLPTTARYVGTDISSTMVRLATERLAPFAPRASVALASGKTALPLEDASVDRFIATYVFDLLPALDQRELLAEVARVLRPEGLLCLCGITPGVTASSRLVMGVWQWLFARNASWVGGCRPVRAAEYLSTDTWHTRYRTVVTAWGVASEVVIAAPPSQLTRA